MNFVGKFDDLRGSLHSGEGIASYSGAQIDMEAHKGLSNTITVTDAHLLFSGNYERSGLDLIISDHDHRVVVPDYFRGEKRPTLVSSEGAPLDAKVIEALTGHTAYAQAGGAVAAKVIGHVVKISGSASVVRNGVAVELNNGDTINQGDLAQTGSNSALGLVLNDGTTFNLSANARLMLNDLVYDPNGTSNTSLFTLVQGAAGFVAGQVAKTGDMKVATPVATMGIRGTAVILDISSVDGKVSISVVDQQDNIVHAVQVYDRNGNLIGTVTSSGSSLTLTPTASFQVIAQESGKTVAQVAQEFNAFQNLLSIYDLGKQLNPNTPPPSDGRRGDANPQSNTKFGSAPILPSEAPSTTVFPPVKAASATTGTDDSSNPTLPNSVIAPPTTTQVVITQSGGSSTTTVDVPTTTLPFVVTPGTITKVSSGPGDHFGPVMTADGHFVTYDPDGAIYLYDRQTDTTVTIASPGNGFTYGSPTISADGHYVVYQGTDGTHNYVFIYDNNPSDENYGHTTQLGIGGAPAVSGDGSRIAVENGSGGIVLYDQQGHVLATITPAAIAAIVAAGGGSAGSLGKPAISADGHVIAFWNADPTNTEQSTSPGELLVYNLATGTITEIATTTHVDGAHAASFSADGHYVVFESDAALAGTSGAHSEIFLYDLNTGQIVFHTDSAVGGSYHPAISADGHYIIFASDAKLTADDTNSLADMYVVDLTHLSNPVYKLVSVLADGTLGNAASNLGGTISAGGLYVAFGSDASNFATGDTNGGGDIFVVDPTSGHSAIIQETANSPSVLSTSGTIALTGEINGIAISVSDPTGRFTAEFDANHNIHWTFNEAKSDFAALNPGEFAVQDFVITLTGASSTTTIPVKVTVFDADLPPVVVADVAPVAAPVTLAHGQEDAPYTITAAALLAGVTDIDSTSLTITSLSVHNGSGTLHDNEDGTWTYTPGKNDHGPVTFDYIASDGSLTAASTASLALLDTTAPTVTLSGSGGLTSSTHVTISGTIDPNDVGTVTLTDNGEALSANIQFGSDGHWTADVTLSDEGEHHIVAHETDAAGNTGDSGEVVYTLDTIEPTISLDGSGGLTSQTHLTISGTVDPNDVGAITLSDNGEALSAKIHVGSDGHWTADVTLSGEGEHHIVAHETDAAGNTGDSGEVVYTLDTIEPTISLNGSGGLTSEKHVTISGTVDPDDVGTVTLSDNDNPLSAEIQFGSDGHWTADVTLSGEGQHHIVAHETDAAGNTGNSGEVVYTLDTIAPTVTLDGSGGLTSETHLTISGTVDPDDVGSITLSDNGETLSANIYFGSGGHWTADVTLSGDGEHHIVAHETDTAGNTGDSNEVVFDLDTTPPDAPTLALAFDSGTSDTDRLTSDQTIIYTPSEASDTLLYKLDGQTDFSTTAPTITGDGWHTVTVEERDAAGNVSSTATLTFDLDTTAPSVTVNTQDSTVSNTHQFVSGSVGADAGSTVKLYDVYNGHETLIETLSAGSGGVWSTTVTLSGDGQHHIVARDSDAAGNTGRDEVVFTLDTTPPENHAPKISVTGPTAALVKADYWNDGVSTSTATITISDPDAGDTVSYDLAGWSHYAYVEFGAYETHSWSNARADALAAGGHLVNITSAAENAIVNDAIVAGGGYVAYTGGTDAAHEGSFVWADGPEAGQAVGYTNWSYGEPNNLGGSRQNPGEDYIAVVSGANNPASGQWNDIPNQYGLAQGYVVEFDAFYQKGTYGYLLLDPATGQLTYHLDNSDPDTRALSDHQHVTDEFDIVVTDGQTSTTEHVAFDVFGDGDRHSVYGSSGNDIFTGSDRAEVFNGLGGNDTVDYSHAAAGNGLDHGITADLSGVATNTGAAARDIYIGIDNLRGTAFDDHLIGDGTNNVLEGGAGHDVLDGKGGIDTASYEHSGAAVHVDLSPGGSIGGGDAEGDTLSSIENLRGSAFNDILRGDNGANIIEGGAGNDMLDGAGGNDTVSYEHATAGVKVDLSISSQAQNTVGAGLDTIANFENVTGSQFNDRLTGDSHDNTFMGLGGNDTFAFNFGSGHDTITDFRPGHDHIELDNFTGVPTDSFGNFTEAQFNAWKAMPGVFTRSGDDTLIHLDGSDTLLLKNVSPASLHANDFIVHPGTT